MKPRPSTQQQEQLVIEFNHLHREGCDVIVRLDDGTEKPTKTRSEAWLLGGHTAVIMLEGISGCYALERVTVKELA